MGVTAATCAMHGVFKPGRASLPYQHAQGLRLWQMAYATQLHVSCSSNAFINTRNICKAYLQAGQISWLCAAPQLPGQALCRAPHKRQCLQVPAVLQ